MSKSDPSQRLPRLIVALEAAVGRLYGSRYNPLFQSGTLVVVFLLILLVSGVWLLLFYRIAEPWNSVARLTENRWLSGWVRGFHRYASAGALLAAGWHALRMFLQRRSWGPRLLAWLTGVALLGLLFACGWTGYVMVWDRFGFELATEGARILDVLPILSEPLRRTFVGDQPVPAVFFFMNLFLHVGLPLGLGLGLWLHVSRLSRPLLLPPRALWVGVVLLFGAVALAWPVAMDPSADPSVLGGTITTDWFYAFWLPLHRLLPPGAAWLGVGSVVTALVAIPWLTRPAEDQRPEPSKVDSRLCTGCRQCALDCPYEAIVMVPRAQGPGELVAKVNPNRCVSCGICAAACDVFAIGPGGRSGTDQLAATRSMLTTAEVVGQTVVVGCRHSGAGSAPHGETGAGHVVVECAGSVHRSVIQDLLDRGARDVVIVSCHARDCWHREGPKWLEERAAGRREPSLPRIGAERVRVIQLGPGERQRAAQLSAPDRGPS
jgi:ferredoxin